MKPYYDTVDRAVITPTWTYAVKYGAPQVEQAQAFGYAQWDKNIQPQLEKAQGVALKQYEQVLGPHVEKLSAAVGPYYDIAHTNALQTHHEIILPSYEFLAPYVVQGYSAAYVFTTDTVVPGAVWAYGAAAEFVDANVVPRLRVLYTQKVEPQLEKLGLKISLFDKTLSTSHRTAHTTAPSSFSKPAQAQASSASTSAKSSSAKTSTTYASTATPVTTSASSVEAPPAATPSSKLKRPEPVVQDQPEPNEDELRLNTRAEVAEDLRMWQDKYAKAADEGAVEIENRVAEISKRIIRRNARTTGQAHVDKLEEAVVGNIVGLRREINDIVGTLKAENTTPQEAEEQIVTAVRRAGVAIKEKAQAVRQWHQDYDQELRDTVSRAAENHFQILGGIRDLALQKIGMKWAWMEGVTYKDWAKYHLLKNRFAEWESDLEQLIVSHPALEEAQAVAQTMEDQAMDVAATAAHELARLKRASNVKLELLDDTDEFDEDTMRENVAAAALAAQLAKEAAEAEAAEAEAAAAATAAEAAAAEAETAEGASSEEPFFETVIEGAETTVVKVAEAEAETVSPEEVSVLVGEATGTVEKVPSSETTTPEEVDVKITSDEEVHLPVDEAVVAEDVPLDVASAGIDATESTNTETPTASATPQSNDAHDEL